VHEVDLERYQIGRYPVTVEEYKHFVEDEGYTNQQWWSAGGFGQKKPGSWNEQVLHPNRPVVEVSWYEAAAYCAWLSDRLRREVRLPTEAEWERAARGTAGRKYPWGKEGPDSERANWRRNVGHTTPVGLYPRGATPEGIEDLAGNVWEWVADWYGKYEKAPANNPKGPTSRASRVVRGGGTRSDARAAYRLSGNPGFRNDFLGFRVVGGVPSS